MSYSKNLLQKSQQLYKEFLPHISVDAVIFGYNDSKLRVLLIQMNFNDEWFLPGGYIQKNEDIENTIKRVVKERTGLQDIFFEEFAIFGDKYRNQNTFKEFDDTLWYKQRFITVAYYALLEFSNVKLLLLDEFAKEIKWICIDNLDNYKIGMDHRTIIEKALKKLQTSISKKPIGLNLLEKKFTLSDLQKLYEAILQTKLNRGNFYRKIKNLDILIKLNETRKGGAYKSPDLYSFNLDNYINLLNKESNNF